MKKVILFLILLVLLPTVSALDCGGVPCEQADFVSVDALRAPSLNLESEDEPLVLGCEATLREKETGSYDIPLPSGDVAISSTDNSIIFEEGGPFIVFGEERNYPADVFMLRTIEDTDAVEVFIGFGDLQEKVAEYSLDTYGTPIASFGQGDLALYTYEADPPSFILGTYYFGFKDAKLLTCELTVLNECNNGLDDDGDGFIDYTGVCSVEGAGHVFCGCDYDASGSLAVDESIGEELCDTNKYRYFCENKEGEVISSSCSGIGGKYFYYDESCSSIEGSSEGERGSCIDANAVVMQEDCLRVFNEKDPVSCLRNHRVDMEVWCEQNYEGGAQSCVDSKGCLEGEVCDLDNFACVSLLSVVQEKQLDYCVSFSDCDRGYVCEQNFCVENIESLGIITNDNLFLAPVKSVGTVFQDVFKGNDPDYQLKKLRDENLNVALLERAAASGKISSEKLIKLKKKSVRRSAVRAKKTTEILTKSSDPDVEIYFNDLEATTSVVDNNVEVLLEQAPELEASSDIQEALFELEEIKSLVVDAGVVSPSLRDNFGDSISKKMVLEEAKRRGLEQEEVLEFVGSKEEEVKIPSAIKEQIQSGEIELSVEQEEKLKEIIDLDPQPSVSKERLREAVDTKQDAQRLKRFVGESQEGEILDLPFKVEQIPEGVERAQRFKDRVGAGFGIGGVPDEVAEGLSEFVDSKEDLQRAAGLIEERATAGATTKERLVDKVSSSPEASSRFKRAAQAGKTSELAQRAKQKATGERTVVRTQRKAEAPTSLSDGTVSLSAKDKLKAKIKSSSKKPTRSQLKRLAAARRATGGVVVDVPKPTNTILDFFFYSN
jgi:hypothetical protein